MLNIDDEYSRVVQKAQRLTQILGLSYSSKYFMGLACIKIKTKIWSIAVAYRPLTEPSYLSCVNRRAAMRGCKQVSLVDSRKRVTLVDNWKWVRRWEIIYTRAPTSDGQSQADSQSWAVTRSHSHKSHGQRVLRGSGSSGPQQTPAERQKKC